MEVPAETVAPASPDSPVSPASPTPPGSTVIGERLAALRAAVDECARHAGREPSSVSILLATKTVPAERILDAVRAGYPLIGENRVQEVRSKAADLAAVPHLTHFIGHLQANKINQLLGLVDCVQTVDSADIAERLQRALDRRDGRLDVMLQVNVSGEETKSGVTPDEAPELFAAVAACDRLTVRGLMTIGLNSPDVAAVRAGYARLRELRDAIATSGRPGAVTVAELSMGMSGDFAEAIAEGATMIRIGSAVFGGRAPVS